MKPLNNKGLRRLVNALYWSFSGLGLAWKNEAAFRQEIILFIILAPLGIWLGETRVEKCLLVGPLFLVLITELLNSAVEAAIDRIGGEDHPLSGMAKDIGSAAVFLALLNALVVWILILC